MSPVLLITFNRPEHTRRTLEALLVQRPNELYIFQDGPRDDNADDLIKCQLVREVIDNQLSKVSFELNIHKHYSNENRGCRDAIIYAISSVLKEHESVIVVEDDIITSPAFLSYMNVALEYYKDNKSVYSISGHSHSPCKFKVPDTYTYDVFASPRLFNWGWATWRDRWEKVDWSMSYYDAFIKNPAQIEAFNRGGDDMLSMLIDEKEGRSSAWDIQFAFDHFKHHAVSIVPCKSYTKNIGCDGSGTHCGSIVEENDEVLCENYEPKLLDVLYFDKEIINSLHNVFARKSRPFWQKAINYIARKLGKKAPFEIKKKVYA
jgi:hypothetical protein